LFRGRSAGTKSDFLSRGISYSYSNFWILMKPVWLLSFIFSYFSDTICSRLSCPIIVSSGCSASEKKGFKYLLCSIPFSTQKTVYAITFVNGCHNYFIFLLTSLLHLSILIYLKARGVNRIYLNVLFRSLYDWSSKW